MYLSYGAIVAFLALFTRDVGISEYTSLFFIAYAIAVFASRPFVSKVFDRRGAGVVIFPALIVLTIGFAILSQMDSVFVLLLSGIIIGLGQGALQGITLSLVAKNTPEHRKGVGTTTYYLMCDVGYSIGPVLSGAVLPHLGFTGLYLATGSIILVTLLLCVAWRKAWR
jgi:MFS family permease